MNDDNNPNIDPANRLPKPVEQAAQMPELSNFTAEQGALQAEQPGRAIPVTHVPTVDPASLASPSSPPPLDDAGKTAGHSPIAPVSAEDADLIEKEWVLRAKAIVEHTKEDPHEQNKEMSKYKADYIKKRYNKDVKVTES